MRLVMHLVLVVLAISFLMGCSSIPLEERSRLQDNYRAQKKFDLLEIQLREELVIHTKARDLVGQLFASLDLAELYSTGLINFAEATAFLERATQLNESLLKEAAYGKSDKKTFIHYIGGFPHQRTHHYDQVQLHIQTLTQYVSRMMGEIQYVSPDAEERAVGATPQQGFDAYEQQSYNIILAEYDRRHKLTQQEKEYFAHLRLVQALIYAFPPSQLSHEQLATVLRHVEAALNYAESQDEDKAITYLYFAKTICEAFRQHDQVAITAFQQFRTRLDRMNAKSQAELDFAKSAKSNSRLKAIALSAGFLAIDAATHAAALSSGHIGGTFLSGAIPDLYTSAAQSARLVQLVGESAYAHDLNTVLNQDEQLLLLDAIGQAYHREKILDQSIALNREAIQIITALRATITTERGRISFAKQKDGIFNRLIDDLMAQRQWDEAWSYSENAHSRTLVDLLGSRRDLELKDASATQYAREMRRQQVHLDHLKAQTEISASQATYANAMAAATAPQRGIQVIAGAPHAKTSAPSTGVSPSTPVSMSKDSIPHTLPQELKSLVSVDVSTLEEVQAELPDRTSLVQFYVSESNVYGWIITATSNIGITLPIKATALQDAVARYRAALLDRDDGTAQKLSRDLYLQVFAPLEKYLQGDRLYIVGHRAIHFLPFDALYDGKVYLISRFKFAILPSASVLTLLKHKNDRKETILSFGNPLLKKVGLDDLPGAEQEAQAVVRLFKFSQVVTGSQATEGLFRKEATNYDVLHLATHAILDETTPLASKLMLAADANHDGSISAAELYTLNLDSSLVSLSACETGLASIANGDELIGLIRGFFYAGARSVLASLWKVDDDATLRLMTSFYRYLATMDKFDALRAAKLDLLGTTHYNQPFYWAAFDLFGMGT